MRKGRKYINEFEKMQVKLALHNQPNLERERNISIGEAEYERFLVRAAMAEAESRRVTAGKINAAGSNRGQDQFSDLPASQGG